MEFSKIDNSWTSRMKVNQTNGALFDWYSWGSWSYCSATCGDGVRWRRRACLKDPRTCPQTSRPNGLYFEKTQLQECQLNPCANRTVTDNKAMLSTRQVGMSIAISAAIIAIVFIVAKTLYCLSKRAKSCCKRFAGSSPDGAHGDESTRASANTHASGAFTEGLNGPVYITITQEMITGGINSLQDSGRGQQTSLNSQSPENRSRTGVHLNPMSLLQGGVNDQLTSAGLALSEREPAVGSENRDQSGTFSSAGGNVPVTMAMSNAQVTRIGLSNTQQIYANISGTEHLGSSDSASSVELAQTNTSLHPIPRTEATAIRETNFTTGHHWEPMNTLTLSAAGSDRDGTNMSTPYTENGAEEEAGLNVDSLATADAAVYEPPSYESLFPLFKRNQTL